MSECVHCSASSEVGRPLSEPVILAVRARSRARPPPLGRRTHLRLALQPPPTPHPRRRHPRGLPLARVLPHLLAAPRTLTQSAHVSCCQTPITFPAGSRKVATPKSPSGYGGVTTSPPRATTFSSVSSTRSTKTYGRTPASPATG